MAPRQSSLRCISAAYELGQVGTNSRVSAVQTGVLWHVLYDKRRVKKHVCLPERSRLQELEMSCIFIFKAALDSVCVCVVFCSCFCFVCVLLVVLLLVFVFVKYQIY